MKPIQTPTHEFIVAVQAAEASLSPDAIAVVLFDRFKLSLADSFRVAWDATAFVAAGILAGDAE